MKIVHKSGCVFLHNLLSLLCKIDRRATFSDKKFKGEENQMIFKGSFLVLAKLSTPWTDNNGNAHTSYSVNVAQDNGRVIDRLRISKEHWDTIGANCEYEITADVSSGKNGLYLRVTDIAPSI